MDPLHELVKSMTASEKGYFKKYVSPQKGGEYLNLFDALAGMDVYDESKLLSRFKKGGRGSSLSRSKNYLYNALIRSLLAYREQSSPKIMLRTLMNEAEMLFDRGLLMQSRKRLDKAKPLAQAGEWFSLWQDILSMQRKFCDIRVYSPEELSIPELTREIEEVDRKDDNYLAYNTIYGELDQISKTSLLVRAPDIKEKLEEIGRRPLMLDENLALSVRSRIARNYILYQSNLMLGNYTASRRHALRQLEVTQANPQAVRAKPALILDVYNMILTALQFAPDEALSEKYMKEFRELKLDNTYQEVVRFQYYNPFALIYYTAQRREAEVLKLGEETLQKLKLYRAALKDELRLSMLLALTDSYVQFGKYSLALDVIELYRHSPPKNVRRDYQNFLLFYSLIAHFELGNLQLVGNQLTNVERTIKRSGEFSPIDALMLKVFACVIEIPDKGTRNARLKQLHGQIKSEIEKAGAHWGNYNSIIAPFIESKMRGKKYHECIDVDGGN